MSIKYNIITAAIIATASNTIMAKEETIPGYVSHGINNYNGNVIGDYSKAMPSVPWLNTFPPVNEIGVYNESSSISGKISESTDRNTPVATTRDAFDFFNPIFNSKGFIDPATINKPLDEIGTTFFGSSAANDRVVPASFSLAGTDPVIYRSKGVNAKPTVGDWEKISGKLTVNHNNDGTSSVMITVHNAFPNALYTLWDVGAMNPLSRNEMSYAVPLGGLPNVIVTDSNGCGYKKVELPYNLTRQCEVGASSCTGYVSAYYHWDGQVYGGSPTADFYGAPLGVYASNHMVWPTSGDLLMKPPTEFSKPTRHGCKSSHPLKNSETESSTK
jgi:hypothetical protein